MYPYLYPEIEELCNFWRFRLDALERKQARKYLVRINYYFSNQMYKKVSEASDIKGDKDQYQIIKYQIIK